VTNSIELHGYLFLYDTFRQRGWSNPRRLTVETETPALELLAQLDIPQEEVAVIFVNGKAHPPSRAAIRPGDRVALVSPGAPMFMDLGSHEQAYGFVN
jgi:sulfur carrier protein ThiS